MYWKSTRATLMMAGLFCPLAPAKYTDQKLPVAAVQAPVKLVKATLIVSDYTNPDSDTQQDQVGGTDVVPAVWYHSLNGPMIFSDVAYHPRTANRTATEATKKKAASDSTTKIK